MPGSAAGLRAVRLVPVDGETIEVKLLTKNTTLSPLPGTGTVMRLAAYFGSIATSCAAGDLECVASAKRAKCD
jgi:hypothetical protein